MHPLHLSLPSGAHFDALHGSDIVRSYAEWLHMPAGERRTLIHVLRKRNMDHTSAAVLWNQRGGKWYPLDPEDLLRARGDDDSWTDMPTTAVDQPPAFRFAVRYTDLYNVKRSSKHTTLTEALTAVLGAWQRVPGPKCMEPMWRGGAPAEGFHLRMEQIGTPRALPLAWAAACNALVSHHATLAYLAKCHACFDGMDRPGALI